MQVFLQVIKEAHFLKSKIDDRRMASVNVTNVGGGHGAGLGVKETVSVEVADVGVEVNEVGVGAHL